MALDERIGRALEVLEHRRHQDCVSEAVRERDLVRRRNNLD
jgi:hypothetical protein